MQILFAPTKLAFLLTNTLVIGLTVVFALLFATGQASAEKPADSEPSQYHVYFLSGQSNMDGYGFNRDLPIHLSSTIANVMIFTGQQAADGEDGGGVGRWELLKPGFGTGFSSDGKTNELSNRFGPELAFGDHLAKHNPGKKIAIIKYSRGGTSLSLAAAGYGTWDPDFSAGNQRNQYDNALTSIREAMSVQDINGDGVSDELIPAGIIWMQGEADAFESAEAVAAYQTNLKRMMDLFRAAFHQDDLPVVIGQIANSTGEDGLPVMKYALQVQSAQAAFVKNDACATLVTEPNGFSFPDGWHYTSQNYLSLGRAFARAVISIRQNCQQIRSN